MVTAREMTKGITSLITLTQRIEAEIKDVRADLKVLTGGLDNIERLLHATNQRVDDLDDKLNTRIQDLDGKLTARIQDLDAKLTARIDDLKVSFGQVKEIEALKAEVREIKAKIQMA
ncbi:MAG: hypothetical protein QXI59_05730 [Candidatus Bathyarchaeia archaeon]